MKILKHLIVSSFKVADHLLQAIELLMIIELNISITRKFLLKWQRKQLYQEDHESDLEV